MNISGSKSGQDAAVGTVEKSEIDRVVPRITRTLFEALDRISLVEKRLNAIADNMLGSVPQKDQFFGSPCVDGEVYAAADLADSVVRRVNELGEILSRLEHL